MDDNEFLKLLQDSDDCPEQLIKMAESPWQKQVAVEFVIQDKKINAQGKDIATLKKITWGIFIATAVAAVVQVISGLSPFL